ncbi:GntR family transcriptional regulator [Cellulosilyticum lentocellum]|uniref:Transcriptional regulator, GntR family n=1 Tax=Cellulosilyticum lentocellum (strain ATCC 49066 / DSM 5427 / NCIMB 11756 / RHM5) TaxID=642492 RepID=F2JHA1_CELLD|nr:GntR family transcriptional regulator [Cellulosilyticum lentocellum]ADZ82999.1 transcriptional regulator, GntR family [Cellulosilyticum lentocellum DSM 5427]
MKWILNEEEPIYIQIARAIEDEILQEGFLEEAQIPSTNELSRVYQINPATVLKGINLLVERNILYKKRGIGMFISTGAVSAIKETRKESFKQVVITNLLEEAKKLGISKKDLIEMIEMSKEEL